MDLIELELKEKHCQAYLNYINHTKEKHRKAFGDRLAELGTPFFRFPCTVAPKAGESQAIDSSEACKEYYRKLSLRYHPDKVGGDGVLFQKISQLYEDQKEEILKRLVESTDAEYTLRLISVEDLQKEINKNTDTYYWNWATGNETSKMFAESMFTDIDPMIEITKKKIEKVNEEISRLKIENKTYENKITAIKAETVELRAEANRIRTEIKEIQTETKEYQEDTSRTKAENDEEISRTKAKNSKVTDSLKAEVAQLEKENAELRVKKFVLETFLGKDVTSEASS